MMLTRFVLPCLLLSLPVSASAVQAHEPMPIATVNGFSQDPPAGGGACVMPNGMGAPCTTPGALSHAEYERLRRAGEPPASQITWLGWAVVVRPHRPVARPSGDVTIRSSCDDYEVRRDYELGLRDDGVVVWRKTRQE